VDSPVGFSSCRATGCRHPNQSVEAARFPTENALLAATKYSEAAGVEHGRDAFPNKRKFSFETL
jgi:hypothetical protein